MMKNLLLCCVALLLSLSFYAQEPGPPIENFQFQQISTKAGANTQMQNVPPHRTCGTMFMDSVRRANDPEVPSLTEFENWLQVKISQEAFGSANVESLPIIVHIIHNGESVGNGSNISAAQVQSQIDVINEDFRRMNSDTVNTPSVYKPVAADPQIEFCLATINEQGNPLSEAGIHRVNRNTAGFAAPPYTATYINNVIKPATIWDPTKYLNIWVLNISGGILGYAQFPDQSGLPGLPAVGGSASTDGVVVGYSYFGRGSFPQISPPYNLGRTTTHEVGHWLGLRHIWGDGGCGASDFCGDTPDADAPNYGCQTSTASCGSDDMVENYMDYSNDACFNLFTQDQKTRMRTVLNNSPRRKELLNSIVCNPNVPPVTNFKGEPTTVFAGGSVNFTDLSSANPTSWQWSFPGGTPNSSTQQNPSIQYQVPGTYPVTLVATNPNGSDNETKSGYITVVTPPGCDTLNFGPPGNLTYYTYQNTGLPLCGWNQFEDKSKANFFENTAPFNYITGGIFFFGAAHKNPNSNATVTFKVWDASGPGGKPGNVLDTARIGLGPLAQVVNAGFLPQVFFGEAVKIPANGKFYYGITMNNFTPLDTLGLVSNAAGQSPPGVAWEQWDDGRWFSFSSDSSVGIDISMFISPYVSQDVPTASFTATDTSVCQGEVIDFSANTSTNGQNFFWVFPGGIPYTANSSNVSVTYDTAGSHAVFLRAYGTCGARNDTLVQDLIEVNSYPNIDSFTTEPAACGQANGSATAVVTGGTAPYTYQWGSGTNNETSPTASNLDEGTYYLFIEDSKGCSDVGIANVSSTGGPAGSVVNQQNVDCYGGSNGSATVDASGGTPPYTYQWSNSGTGASQSGLEAGGYTVTITDSKGCKDQFTFNIAQPDSISINASVTKASCFDNDGSATVNVSGGSPGYTINWSNGQSGITATGLASGTYSVTITDNKSCVKVEQVNVDQFDPVEASASVTADATCANNDGTAQAIVSGGKSPFNFTWSSGTTGNTANGLAAGTYYVTITDDNGCTDVDSVTVALNNNLSASITSDQEICEGESTQVTVTGGDTYDWSTGDNTATINVSPAQTTTYEVFVFLGVCVDTLESEVLVKPLPTTAIQEGDSITVCKDEQFTLTASGAGSYDWSNGETTSSIQLTATTSQNISVEGTTDGCSAADTIAVTVETCTGIDDIDLENAVSVYPNPANNVLQLDITKMIGDKLQLRMYNTSGQVVYSSSIESTGVYTIDISQYAGGIYHLEIGNSKARVDKKVTIIR